MIKRTSFHSNVEVLEIADVIRRFLESLFSPILFGIPLFIDITSEPVSSNAFVSIYLKLFKMVISTVCKRCVTFKLLLFKLLLAIFGSSQ